MLRYDYNEDSDPDEADIEEHMAESEPEPMDTSAINQDIDTQVGEDADHHNAVPGGTINRFLGSLSSLGLPADLFSNEGALFQALHDRARQGQIQNTTLWTSGGSSTSVTFISSQPAGEGAPPIQAADLFQSYVASDVKSAS